MLLLEQSLLITVIFHTIFTGYLWTKSGFPHDWWEVEVAIKVTGVGRLGGDGVVRYWLKNRNYSQECNFEWLLWPFYFDWLVAGYLVHRNCWNRGSSIWKCQYLERSWYFLWFIWQWSTSEWKKKGFVELGSAIIIIEHCSS